MGSKKKSKLIKWFKKRFKLVVYHAENLESTGAYRFNRFGFILINLIAILVLMSIFWIIVVFTPIKALIPGYPDNTIRKHMITNKIRIDSLEYEITIRDNYLELLRNAILGIEPLDSTINIVIPKSAYDDAKALNKTENYDAAKNLYKENLQQTEVLSLFPPVKGVVTNSFNPATGHLGTDIVPEQNSSVYAAKNGTVISANYTMEAGYSILIQHENNVITAYRHNKDILVQQGDQVKAGEQIAIYGNTGEYSTGAHLHFEVWKNGKAVDPEIYVKF
ncbi:MAG TPA: M23 family metallopeptidase [Bacteroidales bacterium]|jgi:murein DD-endopeptidase MepM/ murein hydrolase activator NlpD|nr:M23 family metallopeptidase [Bacteroidales bacterium]MDD4235421.1 M23 family metallopeptidase [Bacteroidales bacterium]MDY0159782.1 M23 family metallopeptidase [Bacteroidales bacterium]HXK81001.1 M23 family metallopeptidase [Bacteroidales bacterium]